METSYVVAGTTMVIADSTTEAEEIARNADLRWDVVSSSVPVGSTTRLNIGLAVAAAFGVGLLAPAGQLVALVTG